MRNKIVKKILTFGVGATCLCFPISTFAQTTIFEAKGVQNYAIEAVSTVEGDNTLAVVDEKDTNEVLFGCPLIDDTYHVIANSGLYVREAPSVESKSIVCLPYGSNITVKGISEDVDWAVVEYNGTDAFVAKKYIEEGAAPQVSSASSQVVYSTSTAAPAVTNSTPTTASNYNGSQLTAYAGVNYGPSGKETYYNLPMDGVVSMMGQYGYSAADYAVREDGVKTLGGYVMVAADLNQHPRGSLVETSLGTGIVADTGGFTTNGSGVSLDIATAW